LQLQDGSFLLAGMYWVDHRDLFGLIRRTDRGLVWLNILYLLPLCLLPFGASQLGRFDREPVALRIYGLVLVAIAGMRLVIWWYVTRSGPFRAWRGAPATMREDEAASSGRLLFRREDTPSSWSTRSSQLPQSDGA
jgi:uncharacterized membrane protein